jgi:CRISPR/Cas system CSM-associated protein Csm4 (group 5 of RAMP superfamily)
MKTLLPGSTAASVPKAVVSEAEVVCSPTTLPSTVGYQVATASSTPSITSFFPASKHSLITPKPLSFEILDDDEEMPEVPLKKKAKTGE